MGTEGLTMYDGDDGFKVKETPSTQPPEPGLSAGPMEGPDGMEKGRSIGNTTPSWDAKGSVPRGNVLESPMDK